ncbi:sodium-dependent transporter [Treponema phagedenis]|uniref:Transporter n=1 Tax=Treponema phagedenis TaxID=162 RepID=A0A0B7GWS2_TREPH|nr:sodium-dependent transporter [Treponema phagedenis]QSH94082.1 sodium-dependent transporter [Treponema phagedenis]QSH98889.1 sodium-dependent transporter [Treponema phagedenis]CEM61081.1 Transporter [Treponema phagedenis]
MKKQEDRELFGSDFGFIIACIGSAVGMGNIWLFPFRAGQLGGAAFLIPYIIFVVLIGYVGIVEEMSFGRAMRTGPLGAFKKATAMHGNNSGEFIGWIPVIGSLGIAIGYAIVVGWILKFTIGSFTGSMIGAENSGAYFGAIAGKFGSLGWHVMGLAITFIIMIAGISSGIEFVNKFMMPAFFVMFIILAIRAATLHGAGSGYAFLTQPDWTKLADPKTWVYALGQAFFSLSLAGSGTVVYGSYLSDKESTTKSAKYVAIFDTIAAILAALVIIPSVFAYGIEPTAGPPLMFITMPMVFKEMPFGAIFAAIFFVAVLFAGVSSLINLFETPVEALQNKFKLSRLASVSIILGLALLVGVFLESGDNLGKWMDVVSIYVIPLGALLSAIMFFWVAGKDLVLKEIAKPQLEPAHSSFYIMGKYVFCGATLIVYILGIFYGGIG